MTAYETHLAERTERHAARLSGVCPDQSPGQAPEPEPYDPADPDERQDEGWW